MGTQQFHVDAKSDAESIIKYTRKPKTPPPYVPRSRSLDDLPGGIRVPLIKKQESRLQQKHEANAAGLEELRMLRQKQGQLVNEIKTTYNLPETTQRRCSSSRLSSSSSLAIIKEETICRNERIEQEETNDFFSQPKARFSISSDDSRCSSGRLSSTRSSNESLNASLEKSEEQLEPETRTRAQILEEFQRNFQQVCERPNLPPRRRASVQVESFAGRPPPPIDRSIRPKLRRASFQCEAVLTKTLDREESVSKTISDFKLQYNFPSPLHAVTRQYGSSSDIRLQEKSEPQPISDKKDLKAILSEWNNEKLSPGRHKSATQVLSSNVAEASCVEDNDRTGLPSHDRNHSCTSDYFGSTETLHTVNTCPFPSTKSANIMERRRQSLPIDLLRDENKLKLPLRRKSFMDKTNNIIDIKHNTSDQLCYLRQMTSLSTEDDDGIFPDEELLQLGSTNKNRPGSLAVKEKNSLKDHDNVKLHEPIPETYSKNQEEKDKLKEYEQNEPNNNKIRITLETEV